MFKRWALESNRPARKSASSCVASGKLLTLWLSFFICKEVVKWALIQELVMPVKPRALRGCHGNG